MVHPNPGDTVSVCNKITVSVPDDRGVSSVNPYSAKVFFYHLSHSVGIHEKERETVLPEITPSATASSVIVVRKKRTSKQTTQERLETDPLHQSVKIGISSMKSSVDFLFPP